MSRDTSSYSSSCTRPEIVCSWLWNSWVCARRVSVIALARAELALQREQLGAVAQGRHGADLAPVVQHPVAVDDEHPAGHDDDVVADVGVADEQVAHAGSRSRSSTRRPSTRRREAEELAGAVAEHGHGAVPADRDDALADRVQQRLALVGEGARSRRAPGRGYDA